jgi:hypothetical protein
MDTKFFLEDPSILVTDMVIFPTANMTREQKLNALTRLAVIISAGMFVMEYNGWQTFLLSAVLILIVIQYVSKARKSSSEDVKENFTIVPTYMDDDFSSTVVAPTFAEEWRIPPPSYDQYTSVENLEPTWQEPVRPQSYPYGQYLTKTNLLPSDEYMTHMNPSGGARSAREYVNSSFTKHRMAYQENMMAIFKKKLNRRFRTNTANGDSFSPFHSY